MFVLLVFVGLILAADEAVRGQCRRMLTGTAVIEALVDSGPCALTFAHPPELRGRETLSVASGRGRLMPTDAVTDQPGTLPESVRQTRSDQTQLIEFMFYSRLCRG
jgi:hypothetical protein